MTGQEREALAHFIVRIVGDEPEGPVEREALSAARAALAAREEPLHIFIDRKRFGNVIESMTGLALRQLPSPAVGHDYDVWEECEAEDRLVRDDDIFKVESGQKFYTTPSRIVASAAAREDTERPDACPCNFEGQPCVLTGYHDKHRTEGGYEWARGLSQNEKSALEAAILGSEVAESAAERIWKAARKFGVQDTERQQGRLTRTELECLNADLGSPCDRLHPPHPGSVSVGIRESYREKLFGVRDIERPATRTSDDDLADLQACAQEVRDAFAGEDTDQDNQGLREAANGVLDHYYHRRAKSLLQDRTLEAAMQRLHRAVAASSRDMSPVVRDTEQEHER